MNIVRRSCRRCRRLVYATAAWLLWLVVMLANSALRQAPRTPALALYEMLTGRTPFETRELMSAGLEEVRRKIREDEPPKPSTRLSTLGKAELTPLAKNRGTEARQIAKHLPR